MYEEEKTTDNNTPDDQSEQDADQNDTPDTADQKDTTDSLQELKGQVADAYIALLDKTKGGLFALGAEFGVSLNPMKSFAKDFLLSAETKTSDEGFFDKMGANLKKQLLGKISGQSATLAYDQKDLSAMKLLISKGTKEELDRYLTMMVDEGKDPTKQDMQNTEDKQQTPSPEDGTNNVAPVVAMTGAGAVVKEYQTGKEIKEGKNITEYLSLLTGGEKNMFKVRQTIEKQLVTCPFMGTDLQINKYIIGPLQQVEKEIKESDDPEVKNFVFKDMSTYNRRNVKGGNSLSYHAAALAIDIDPANNPMIQSKWPKIKTNIPEGLVKIFNNNGFIWGGNRGKTDREKGSSFTSDAMHFEFKDIDYLASVVDNKEESKLAA